MSESGGFVVFPLPSRPENIDEVQIAEIVPDPDDPLEVLRVTICKKEDGSEEMESIIRTNLRADIAVQLLVELAQDIISGRIIW